MRGYVHGDGNRVDLRSTRGSAGVGTGIKKQEGKEDGGEENSGLKVWFEIIPQRAHVSKKAEGDVALF